MCVCVCVFSVDRWPDVVTTWSRARFECCRFWGPCEKSVGFCWICAFWICFCKDKNDSGLIDKEEFIKALQNPEELLAKPEEKKEPAGPAPWCPTVSYCSEAGPFNHWLLGSHCLLGLTDDTAPHFYDGNDIRRIVLWRLKFLLTLLHLIFEQAGASCDRSREQRRCHQSVGQDPWADVRL